MDHEIRCRAIDALVGAGWGSAPGERIDALEAAGLAVVDAATLRALLDTLDEYLPTDDEQLGYGAFHGGDPRDFTPDPECSTDAECRAHQAACEAWARGDEIEIRGGCEERDVEPGSEQAVAADAIRNGAALAQVSPGHVRIAWQTFGIGTYVHRDPTVARLDGQVRALRASLPRHTHAGPDLGGICVGCPCTERGAE